MFLSVFDLFKVGIGPSSSHTIGPMVAAARFLDHLRAQPFAVAGLQASLHGSLAFTGVGHATDRAVILGLAGFRADDYDAAKAETELARIRAEGHVTPPGLGQLRFRPETDLVFDYGPALPGHANGLILRGTDAQGDVITSITYYSVGGGFVLTADELGQGKATDAAPPVPFPFATAKAMLDMAAESGLSIAAMKRQNELTRRTAADIDRGLDRIWSVMNACIDRGLAGEGILPGGLRVPRRARGIHEKLLAERGMNLTAPHTINDWMSTYAMAVNEENAAGGQVVTAPHQRRRRRGARNDPLLARPCPRRQPRPGRRVPAHRRRHRRAHQAQRLDLGRRMRLPGRGGQRRRHGRRGPGRRARRDARTG